MTERKMRLYGNIGMLSIIVMLMLASSTPTGAHGTAIMRVTGVGAVITGVWAARRLTKGDKNERL